MPNPTELLRLRYCVSAFNPDIEWNDCLTTLLSHRSIRAYLPLAPHPSPLLIN
jgi:hypothetical protein